MLKSLDYYAGMVKEDLTENKDRDALFQKIDEINECKYTPPAELSALPWWKTLKVMAPRDALKSASRALSRLMPKIEIQPLNGFEGELDRVEMMERVFEWQFWQMNRRGSRYPFGDIVDDALKYMQVCFQPIYVPYYFKDRNDPRSQYIKRMGDFVWKRHNPRNVYMRGDDYAPISNTVVQEMTVDQLIAEYGQDHKGIRKLIEKVKTDDKTDYGNVKVTYCDLTDWENRACWIDTSDGKQLDGERIELVREAHGLPFFNWVYRKGDDPLLKGLVDSGAYDTVNLIASLRYGLIIGTVAQPAGKSKTFGGEAPEIDYTDPTSTVNLRPGEEYEALSPRIMDPHLTEILNEQISSIHASTVARALGTLEFSPNMTYSGMNMIVQTAVSSLSHAIRLSETAIEDGFYLNLHWLKYAKESLSGYRMKTRQIGERIMQRGAQVSISGMEVNPEDVHITVSLRADTPTDKAERTQRAIQLHSQLGVPLKTVYEDAGIENYDVQQSEFAQEQLDNAALQNTLFKMSLQAQEELKAKLMQDITKQMQQQQPQEAQQFPQGATANPNEGWPPAIRAAPGMTREQISGETVNGGETAGV